jgi:hypothetical protein
MPASSSFRSSPGHAALGNELCIAPADRHDHQNGRQQWNMLIPLLFFFINNNRGQRPSYGPLKLKLRHSNIYHNVISLLLCFGHPPTTMDAISATIVAGGGANIN